MKIESLKPGMVVYDVGTQKMGNTCLKTKVVWPVKIVEVNEVEDWVKAEWNHNYLRKFHARSFRKWKEKPPLLIRNICGSSRLATREEIKAAKAK